MNTLNSLLFWLTKGYFHSDYPTFWTRKGAKAWLVNNNLWCNTDTHSQHGHIHYVPGFNTTNSQGSGDKNEENTDAK